jgi:hypothetical protein
MKKITFILYPLIGFLIIYLLGAFYNVTFNLSKWSKDSLEAVSIISGFSIMLGFLVAFLSSVSFKKSLLNNPDADKLVDHYVQNILGEDLQHGIMSKNIKTLIRHLESM